LTEVTRANQLRISIEARPHAACAERAPDSRATAKALLAFRSHADIEAVPRRSRARLAEEPFTSRAGLRRESAAIRDRGEFSWRGTYYGVWALRIPLLDDDGRALAAIGMISLTGRDEAIERILLASGLDAAAEGRRAEAIISTERGLGELAVKVVS
jgi:DNA-binding IclR family transcriptional regulator